VLCEFSTSLDQSDLVCHVSKNLARTRGVTIQAQITNGRRTPASKTTGNKTYNRKDRLLIIVSLSLAMNPESERTTTNANQIQISPLVSINRADPQIAGLVRLISLTSSELVRSCKILHGWFRRAETKQKT
jgi:hypothetical protein